MSARRPDGRYRIADAIRAKIESGEYPAGGSVPSETQLAQEYGVAKMTARGALEVLKAEGLLVAQQGRSTRVREFNPIRRRASSRLSAEVWQAGHSIWSSDTTSRSPDVDQVEVSEDPADDRVAGGLGVAVGEPICVRSRRHVLDGKPVLISTSYLPAALVSGSAVTQVDTGPGGIYYMPCAQTGEVSRDVPVRFLNLASGEDRSFATLKGAGWPPTGRQDGFLLVSPNGRTLFYSHLENREADLMLIEGFR